MFKPHVLRRSFSLFRRAPTSAAVRSAAHDGHPAIRVQRVRIRQRLFTKARLAGTLVVAVGAWTVLDWLDEEVEDEQEIARPVRRVQPPHIPQEGASDRGGEREVTDEEEKEYDNGDDDDDNDDEDGEEEEEEDDSLIFFPTGFSRPRPRRFYKGSDPEWQTFARLAPDRQRLDKIRGELVSMVRDLATKNPRFGMLLGSIDAKKGHIWIEIKFPDGPPLEYERPGIELTEDLTLRKTTRTVHELHHKKLANILMPTNTLTSVLYDMKRRTLASWESLCNYTGLSESSHSQDVVKKLFVTPATSDHPIQTPVAPNAPALPSPTGTEKQAAPPSPANPALDKLGLSLPDPKQVPTMDLSYFRHTLRRNKKPMAIEPPRGTFIVSGLIEIIGDRAKMTLDVTSLYDPSIGKYVMLQARVRSMTQYKQKPRGGP
ncbi:hypothetical protein GRF29_77g1000491 [Pseudopithomyces chartarum]|uniref:Uncharacterized protein n=1 Tax=Pseudopithomyces chartarum TaxID=1892770 RepID=A0AAN6RIK8_9PLEO|nr:hypothetical protein GRF29_77g1000491 [Pseudopithomyces chartarum]